MKFRIAPASLDIDPILRNTVNPLGNVGAAGSLENKTSTTPVVGFLIA